MFVRIINETGNRMTHKRIADAGVRGSDGARRVLLSRVGGR
jgi:hypothetical protein